MSSHPNDLQIGFHTGPVRRWRDAAATYTGSDLPVYGRQQEDGPAELNHLSRPVAILLLLPAVGFAAATRWRQLCRTKRALMELSAWQRDDCGMNRPDIPTACDMERVARRRIANGMPTDWC